MSLFPTNWRLFCLKMPIVKKSVCFNKALKFTPDKVFINVPKVKHVRKIWWNAIRRQPPINVGVWFCCEDHFNVIAMSNLLKMFTCDVTTTLLQKGR